MAETPLNINIESPQVDAPVSINFDGIFGGIRDSLDKLVDDFRGGSVVAITGIMLAAMFLIGGIYVWRKV